MNDTYLPSPENVAGQLAAMQAAMNALIRELDDEALRKLKTETAGALAHFIADPKASDDFIDGIHYAVKIMLNEQR